MSTSTRKTAGDRYFLTLSAYDVWLPDTEFSVTAEQWSSEDDIRTLGFEAGKEFGKYGIEQQARIIQDYYSGAIAPSQQGAVETMLRKEGLLGGNEPESTGSSSGAGS